MDDRHSGQDRPRSNGPCACGSALPAALCCDARRAFAGETQPASFVPTDEVDITAAQWELSIATVQAIVTVLPDVPVPLLGNRTPRALCAAGPEERAAAHAYLDSLANTAEAVGIEFPSGDIVREMFTPETRKHSCDDRDNITLAMLTLQLLARGFEEPAVLGAHRLFRDIKRVMAEHFRKPNSFAASVDFALCWMHFRPESRQEVADIYQVGDATVAKHFGAMKQELKLVWYDPRYAVQDPEWQEMLERHAQAMANGEAADPE
ncbi:MAG TPA: hypothetical protein QGH10_17195 [Armatimonadota bacterium]|nr:hypothetical protein [Armatimonadota bacterium]